MVLYEATDRMIELKSKEVRVHRIDLKPGSLSLMRSLLSREEILRADQLLKNQDAERFIQFRGTLRLLLGKYCQVPPEKIEIVTTEKGKPVLKPKELERTGIHFNLSHCGDQGLIAFSRDAEIGIDLEFIQDAGELDTLAASVFPPKAFQHFLEAKPSQKTEVFFRLWTMAEALGKCTGFGWGKTQELDHWLASTPGPFELQSKSTRFRIQGFTPLPNYTAAIAVNLGPVES